MKKLLVVLCILLVPGLSSAGEEIVVKNVTANAAQPDSNLPDIFFLKAHTCAAVAVNCGSDNLVNNPFSAYIKVFVPSTQVYTRHYIVTDIEGAFVGYQFGESSLTNGTHDIFVAFSLTSGKLYRFIAIVVGADAKATVSEGFIFRVVS
ncbi:MAG: hypothetical protein HY574_04300 [candidate division NC10 bacterium]|nr:hypothetical protein [candidate division NC10 bacterium]